MRALQYAFDEAVTSMWRGRQSGLLSTATIAVALFVLGGFLMLTANLERLTAEWTRAAGVSIYLDDEATPADRGDIERLLAPGGPVAAYEYVSKDEARRRFSQTFADLAPTLDALHSNPLPASYEARLVAAADTPEQTARLVENLRQSAGVADVRYDRQWIDRLMAVVTVVRSVGLVLGSVLTFAAALTVANVIRLALYARRDEIEIMKLVGAPRAFIRGPFVMEGVLHGGIGAVAALALLSIVFLVVSSRYLQPLAAALHVSAFRFLPLELCLALVAGGMAVGCLGGTVAAADRT